MIGENKMKYPLIFSALTVALSLTAHTASADTESTLQITTKGQTPLKLYVLDCGKIEARDLSLFNPNISKGTVKQLANPCYLIKHPKGTLLWDTGLSDQLITQENGIEVYGGAFNMSVIKTLSSQLSDINVKPKQIDYVAFSHLHNDHTGNAKLFMDSTWLIQKAEYQVATSEHAHNHGYSPVDYKMMASENVNQLSGDHDVFGDGSVVIVSTPGHSAGHQSLFVDLPKTGSVILSGDLYHFKENRDNYGIPGWNDKKSTISSFALIDQLLDKTNATLWIHHDQDDFESRKHSPSFYE